MRRRGVGMVVAGLVVLAAGSMRLAAQETPWLTAMNQKLSQTLSVNFDGTELSDALNYFRDRTGVNVILARPPDTPMPKITLNLHNLEAESALAWTVRLAGYSYAIRNQAVFVAPPAQINQEWRQSMRLRYLERMGNEKRGWYKQVSTALETPIDVDVKNEPIDRAMEMVAQKSGLNIVVDQAAVRGARPVTLEAKGMTVRNVITWETKLAELRYVVEDEVIYVTNDAGLAALRLESGSNVPARFLTPVSFQFNNTELTRALRHLQQISDVGIEVENPPAVERHVTMSVQDMSLDRALRMLMDQTGLTYAVSYRDNTMVVSLPVQAAVPKKKEEGAGAPAPK